MSDPLDDLRARWRDLDGPPLETPPDEAERATLAWMRGAWARLEAPLPPRALRPRPVHRLVPLAAGLAAALLALVGLGTLARRAPTEAPRHDPPPVHASIRRDGVAELRAGAVTLVLLDEGATSKPTNEKDEQR